MICYKGSMRTLSAPAALFAAAALALSLSACGPPTKHEMLNAAEGAQTRAELEAALGAPDDRDKMGPIETWVYQARDGEVVFIITGDVVRLKAAD